MGAVLVQAEGSGRRLDEQANGGKMMRTREQIELEILALEPFAKDYDTDRQSNDTCLAAGAHDALRWALGLAEESISEVLTRE